MTRRLCIALVFVIMLTALGALAPAALAEDARLVMRTDGTVFAGQLVPRQVDPEGDPYRYEVEQDEVYFGIDRVSKVDFELSRFSNGTRMRIVKLWQDGESDIAQTDFAENKAGIWPQKHTLSTYLGVGEYRISVWADYYDGRPVTLQYWLKAKATPVPAPAPDVEDPFGACPISLGQDYQDVLGVEEDRRTFRFRLPSDAKVEVSLKGGSREWVGMELFFLDTPNPEDPNDEGMRFLYNQAPPMVPQQKKPVNTTKAFNIRGGRDYYVSVYRENRWQSAAPFSLQVKSKPWVSPKIKLDKSYTFAQGGRQWINPYGDTNRVHGLEFDWACSPESVAAVSEDGTIECRGVGKATFKVNLKSDPAKTYTATINVVANEFQRAKPLAAKAKAVYVSIKRLKFAANGSAEAELFVFNKSGEPISGIDFRRAEMRFLRQGGYFMHSQIDPAIKELHAFPQPLQNGNYTTLTLTFGPEGPMEWEQIVPEQTDLTGSGDGLRIEDLACYTALTPKGVRAAFPRIRVLNGRDRGVYAARQAAEQPMPNR